MQGKPSFWNLRTLGGTLILMVSLTFGNAQALGTSTLTQEQKASDFRQLLAQIQSGYGPRLYKSEIQSIDIEALSQKYLNKILQTKNNGEFYYTLVQFISEFHDGHFVALVPSLQVAALPFDTDLVQGHVLIDKINREKLPENIFPFVKGDEILAVNGQPIDHVLDVLQAYRGAGFSLSERRGAAQALTMRTGSRMPVPTGEVSFQIRRGTSSVIAEAKLTWTVTGEVIDEETSVLFGGGRFFSFPTPVNYNDLSIFPLQDGLQNPMVEKSFRCSGTSRIDRPPGAKILMEKPFVAYTYPTSQGEVGYLRLPHYTPPRDAEVKGSEEADRLAYESRFQQYEYIVSELERNTVGLVIDQDHNCGGSVDYLHQIVSLFMKNEFPAVQFQLLANKQEYLDFSDWLNLAPENTLIRQNLRRVRDLIKTSWLKGEYLTPLTALDGTPGIRANSINYSHPILILIDEMSGSGGDAFPALMKGLGRAKLLGTRTMGLGGHVAEQPPLYFSQMKSYMTKSLFYRPDGVAVENNGAVPDFPYEITRDDFMYGYQNYREFYTEKLLDLVKESQGE